MGSSFGALASLSTAVRYPETYGSLLLQSGSFLFTDACDGANTYYINYQGDAAVLRPSTHLEMYLENRLFPLSNYRYSVGDERVTAPAAAAQQEDRA